MKKTTLILSLFVFATTIFTGCNKKKLDDLEKDLAATKSELETIKNSDNTNSGLLQSNNPILVTVKGNRKFDSTAFNYTSAFDFMWGEKHNDQSVYTYADGTMNFALEKYSNVNGSYYTEISIDGYDPEVGINSADIYVYTSNSFTQTDTSASLKFNQTGDNYDRENLTVNSFSYNKDTRQISFNFTVKDVELNDYNSTDNASVVTFQYEGTLTPSNSVNKTAAK